MHRQSRHFTLLLTSLIATSTFADTVTFAVDGTNPKVSSSTQLNSSVSMTLVQYPSGDAHLVGGELMAEALQVIGNGHANTNAPTGSLTSTLTFSGSFTPTWNITLSPSVPHSEAHCVAKLQLLYKSLVTASADWLNKNPPTQSASLTVSKVSWADVGKSRTISATATHTAPDDSEYNPSNNMYGIDASNVIRTFQLDRQSNGTYTATNCAVFISANTVNGNCSVPNQNATEPATAYSGVPTSRLSCTGVLLSYFN